MVKKLFGILAIIALTVSLSWADVELDVDGNNAQDINKGGTNATTAAGARTNLGLVPGTNFYTVEAADLLLGAKQDYLSATYDTAEKLTALFAAKVSTSGTPAANDFARFTDENTIEGRSYAEVRGDLDLEPGIDFYSPSATDTLLNAKVSTEDINTAAELETVANLGAYASNILSYATKAAMQGDISLDDLVTLSGVLEGAANLGTFTGTTIADNQTIKEALQALETAVEGAAGGHDAVTLNASATAGGLSLSTQELSLNTTTLKNVLDDLTWTFAGTVTAGGFATPKTSGVGGSSLFYEANSTDTTGVGFYGPASITETFYHQFPNAQPSGSFYLWSTPAGTSGPDSSKLSTATLYGVSGSDTTAITGTKGTNGDLVIWNADGDAVDGPTPPTGTIVGTSDTQTLTNKTLDANGTGNTIKGYGYILLQKPNHFGAGVTQQTTATAVSYGQALFVDDTDKATNWVEYVCEVPRDIDTSVNPAAWFKFKLGGADTGDHEYEISMVSIAASAAYDGTPGNAVSLGYTSDASGADGDVEEASLADLTAWESNVTAGNLWIIRVARDGDHANDTSTVDSYSGPLTIRYGFTQ